MSIFDLYSKRQKNKKGNPDVYKYNSIDQKLKVQAIHIIRDTMGIESPYNQITNDTYREIHEILCKEYGVFSLIKHETSNFKAVYDYFLQSNDYEQCLDIIELSFQVIDTIVREKEWMYSQAFGVKQKPDSAISEINIRFKEAAIGYQFESGELIRVDSQIIHADVVKPLLSLLASKKEYRGANAEFLKAHEHYRHSRYKECLVECLKSFESLMKGICDKRAWSYEKTAPAQKLITICLEKNLVPAYLQNQFSSIKALLESGVPTVRNKVGAHGQGAIVTTVPEHLASYALHLTATNLLFLVKCDEEYK